MRSCASISPSARTPGCLARLRLFGDDDVDGQQQFAPAALGEGHDAPRRLRQVLLAIGGCDVPAWANRKVLAMPRRSPAGPASGSDCAAGPAWSRPWSRHDAEHRPLRRAQRRVQRGELAPHRLAGVGGQQAWPGRRSRRGRGVRPRRRRRHRGHRSPPVPWRSRRGRLLRRRGSANFPAAERRRLASPPRPPRPGRQRSRRRKPPARRAIAPAAPRPASGSSRARACPWAGRSG